MRIVVDAMGGDFAPREPVRGALEAASILAGDVERLILVGREDDIRRELPVGNLPDRLEIVHASEVVAMDEAPAIAIRRKKDSSISRGVELVKAGRADAFFSAGSTGACVAAAQLKLRALEGILRPAIAAVMPTIRNPFVLLDAGANTDCTPAMLVQFAIMGSIYSRQVLGRPEPTVGLLSVGTEDSKGNEMTKETFGLLEKAPIRFHGNVEGHDLFEGAVDVVVCDGFVGNVVLKTAESASHAIKHWIKEEVRASFAATLGAALMSGVFRNLKRKSDPANYGGAPLLGANGVVIIGHGASNARAVANGIRVAGEAVRNQVNPLIIEKIRELAAV